MRPTILSRPRTSYQANSTSKAQYPKPASTQRRPLWTLNDSETFPLRNSVWPFDFRARVSFFRSRCSMRYSHLQIKIAHPHSSRHNDIMRHFLLERLWEIAKDHDLKMMSKRMRHSWTAQELYTSKETYFSSRVYEDNAVLFSVHDDWRPLSRSCI
jgi:hypothetical protein